jgi:pentatricopeptide repeat protein
VIRFNQRVLIAGMTRSGKSELARYLFAQMRCRRVIVDPKREWSLGVGIPRVELTATTPERAEAEVERIDFAQPVVHVSPAWLGRRGAKDAARYQLEALFGRLARLPGDLHVWIDEGYGVSSASWAPAGLIQLEVAGGGMGKGTTTCTQRPVNVAKELLTEADHLFLFGPLDREDVAETLRGCTSFIAPERALELMSAQPRYGYLYVSKPDRSYAIGPPLPAHLRTASAGIRRQLDDAGAPPELVEPDDQAPDLNKLD